MRVVAFCVALSTLFVCGCGGGELSSAEPAGIGATEPDRPVGD